MDIQVLIGLFFIKVLQLIGKKVKGVCWRAICICSL